MQERTGDLHPKPLFRIRPDLAAWDVIGASPEQAFVSHSAALPVRDPAQSVEGSGAACLGSQSEPQPQTLFRIGLSRRRLSVEEPLDWNTQNVRYLMQARLKGVYLDPAFDAPAGLGDAGYLTLPEMDVAWLLPNSSLCEGWLGWAAMIFVTDVSGQCIYTCPEWQALTGQSGVDALGRGWITRIHPDDRGVATGTLDAALAKASEFSIRYRLLKPDDTPRWVGAGGVLSFGMQDGGFIGYLGSVTELAGGPMTRLGPSATSGGSCRPHLTRRPCRSTPSTSWLTTSSLLIR